MTRSKTPPPVATIKRRPVCGEYAEKIIAGKITLADVPEQWQGIVASMLIHPIWLIAEEVVSYRDKARRAAALNRVPASIRADVEVQARKIFASRLQAALQ